MDSTYDARSSTHEIIGFIYNDETRGEVVPDVVRSKGYLEEIAIDPFSTACAFIRVILEDVLDDGINGQMNEHEFAILEELATIITQKAGLPVEPRIA